MLHSTFLLPAALAAFLPIAHSMAISEMSSSKASKDPYQVVWTTPSADASGSMPMGNGEVGINLWVEKNGDLFFYISRSDSLSEVARLVKVGGVRVSISPNPLEHSVPFRQELHMRDGVCQITMGEGAKKVVLKVFVDADSPVIYCVGNSASPISVKATALCWRREQRAIPSGEEQSSAWSMKDAPFPLIESADVFPVGIGDAAAWYHRDEKGLESAFPSTLKVQSLESLSGKVHDPLLDRTFGGWMVGTGFKAAPGHTIETRRSIKSFSLRVAVPCAQTPTAKDWMETAKKIADESGDDRAAMQRTAGWWKAYWERSWVIVNHAPSQINVPGAEHPLRIGYDSNGQNKFPGEVARIAVYDRALTPVEIGDLAASGRDEKPPVIKDILFEGDGSPREIANKRLDFSHGFTLDAWIKPDGVGVGRIFDKLTAGRQDGLLFDVYPQNRLRLIVGALQLETSANVSTGQWRNVAAVYSAESGVASIYLDGKLAAQSTAVATASSITEGYILQDYVQACGGRGNYPIKFNGGIFTVEPKASGKPYDPDWRAWGECYWWQNTRHMYHPMLASGDYDMMSPLFTMYEDVRPLCEARTELYHHAQGCYFPETMTAWGTYSNADYGWNRTGHEPNDVQSPWWRYAWNQGPELVALMLDRWDYTEDQVFLQKQLLPMAVSVLKYFDTRFKKDASGRIVLDPDQAIETYWSGVINDTPDIAGLNDITARLCELPQNLTTPRERQFFLHMRQACPPVATEEAVVDGKTVRIIAPAEKYDKHTTNSENPELYAVWPFRLYGVGRPGLEMARETYAHRLFHLDVGWGYDGNCAALLGLRDEAARILKIKCVNSNPAYRWPATWGPNFDWLPDQNHGGNLLETTQLMLLQGLGRKILLLPAWPQNWDVDFKLHAPYKTTLECSYRNGKIVYLKVTPASRAKDVVDMSHKSIL